MTPEKQDRFRAAMRKAALKKKYGLTPADYANMLAAQGGVCAICNSAEPMKHKKTGQAFELSVDHDHRTGKVRGLLCHACNTGMGKFEDSVELLLSAVTYLESHKPA
jgi:hypothetical protein